MADNNARVTGGEWRVFIIVDRESFCDVFSNFISSRDKMIDDDVLWCLSFTLIIEVL